MQFPPLLRDVVRGAGYGAALALFFIGIGVLRAVVALISGAHMNPLTPEDARVLVFYVGGFTVAGALLGFLLRRLDAMLLKYLGFMAGGAVVMLAIATGDQGGLRALDRTDWIALPALGGALGLAVGYGFLRNRRS